MSTIRCVYESEPNFPATDQHPSAVRYTVSGKFVDAIGGAPTAQEVQDFLNPPPPTPDQLEVLCQGYLNGGGGADPRKLFKAKLVSDLAFRLGVAPGALTPAQLLAERNRIAAIYKNL